MVTADTSALIAVVLGEPDAEVYASVLTQSAGDITVSATTIVESNIVLLARQGDEAAADLDKLLDLIGAETTPVDNDQARLAISAWRRFGKGRHPAGLNLGDCFSYALTKSIGSALLYKGNDFSQTDVISAL